MSVMKTRPFGIPTGLNFGVSELITEKMDSTGTVGFPPVSQVSVD